MSVSRRSLIVIVFFSIVIVACAEHFALGQRCLHPDFKVELLYSVPEIEHPSVVACDDKGNLFVGEDPMDMRGPAKSEFDRVLRIEFGPDGKPLRKTVFCDKLSAVFGLIWQDGALYVMHAPHYSVFRDTDGDGVADERKDLADGFGPPAGIYGFNDHIVTGTRLGLDGRVYVSVGDKGVPKAVGADGSAITLEGGGVIRMKLDGTQLEIVTSGTRNHLDVAMDSLDNIFTYDNTDDGLGWWTRFTHHVPTGYYGYPYDYHPHPDRHLPRISEHGGGSPVGAACYREAAWPATYVDSPFFCEWGKQKVQRFKLKPHGASFTAEIEDFLVHDGSSEPFRPLDICFSPDGRHMYLADWNFNGWVNPEVKGRLYRITYAGNDSASKNDPPRADDNASSEQWVRSLAHPSYSERLRAQQQLARLPDRTGIIAAHRWLSHDTSSPYGRVHAAWVLYQYLSANRSAEFISTLNRSLRRDTSPIVRSQVARILGMLREREAIGGLAEAIQHDQDPTVRMQAAIALGQIGEPPSKATWKSVDSGQAGIVVPRTDASTLETMAVGDANVAGVLAVGLQDKDPYVRHVVIQALRRVNAWTGAANLVMSQGDVESRANLILALTTVYDGDAVKVLREFALDSETPALQVKAVEALAEVHRRAAPYEKGWWGTQPARGQPVRGKLHEWSGTSTVLAALRDVMNDSKTSRAKLEVAKAWRRVEDPAALPILRQSANSSDQTDLALEAMITLATLKDRESIDLFTKIASDEDRAENMRREAIRGLSSIGSTEAVKQLVDIVASPQSSASLVLATLEALGGLKAKDGIETVSNRLGDPKPEIRARAAEALAQIAGGEAAPKIVELLKDKEPVVRKAVLGVLRNLANRETVPAVIEASIDPNVKFEAQLALAALPDRRALGLYLDGITSPNPELRAACLNALVTIRDTVADDILALYRGKELAPSAFGPLQVVFSTPSPIAKWQIIGPFPKKSDDPAPIFDRDGAPDLAQTVHIGKRDVTWKEVESKDPNGRVSPGQHVRRPHDSVWLHGYAAIEAESDGPRNFVVGSDDQLRVWVNGKKLYEHLDSRGWAKEQGRFVAELRKGVNHVWIESGNDSGPWDYSVGVSTSDSRFAFLFENAPAQSGIADFRDFASKNQGDVDRGKRVFSNAQGVGCIKCHAVDGVGGKVGPDLIGISSRYPREELVKSILEPSARIANGFDTGIVITNDGKSLTGVLKLDSPEAVELMLPDGKVVRIPADEIDEKSRSPISTMPNGLKDGMSLQDFADIVAFLESLKQRQ